MLTFLAEPGPNLYTENSKGYICSADQQELGMTDGLKASQN